MTTFKRYFATLFITAVLMLEEIIHARLIDHTSHLLKSENPSVNLMHRGYNQPEINHLRVKRQFYPYGSDPFYHRAHIPILVGGFGGGFGIGGFGGHGFGGHGFGGHGFGGHGIGGHGFGGHGFGGHGFGGHGIGGRGGGHGGRG